MLFLVELRCSIPPIAGTTGIHVVPVVPEAVLFKEIPITWIQVVEEAAATASLVTATGRADVVVS